MMFEKILNSESAVMRFLGKIADLVWLNILTMICCLPVITAGASMCAMYSVALKIRRNEEGSIHRDFFGAFKENIMQATLLWGMILAAIAVPVADIALMYYGIIPAGNIIKGIMVTVALLIVLGTAFVFPLLSHFYNTPANTIRNSFMLALSRPHIALAMVLVYTIVPLLAYHFVQALPAVFFFSLAFPGYLGVCMYDGIFIILEENAPQTGE